MTITETKKLNQIKPEKMYSAREALPFVSIFKKEGDFREFLKEDIHGRNLFNAKVYTAKSQRRFVIRGMDLKQGIVQFARI